MAYDLTWLKGAGLDTESGIAYTGSEEKYISALQRFFAGYEKNRGKVEAFYADQDYESYMITVHALKSNAKMIGASDLSKSFEMLEMAARDKKTDIIEAETAPTLKAYEELIGSLSPINEVGDVKPADEISGEVAKETAERLLAALDDFDDDGAASLIKKLSGYPFRLTQRDLLKKASGYVEDFMYEEAAEVIREILPAIE